MNVSVAGRTQYFFLLEEEEEEEEIETDREKRETNDNMLKYGKTECSMDTLRGALYRVSKKKVGEFERLKTKRTFGGRRETIKGNEERGHMEKQDLDGSVNRFGCTPGRFNRSVGVGSL
ncbi:hypothetical protein RUM44_012837, partial [Polyplax serrata]